MINLCRHYFPSWLAVMNSLAERKPSKKRMHEFDQLDESYATIPSFTETVNWKFEGLNSNIFFWPVNQPPSSDNDMSPHAAGLVGWLCPTSKPQTPRKPHLLAGCQGLGGGIKERPYKGQTGLQQKSYLLLMVQKFHPRPTTNSLDVYEYIYICIDYIWLYIRCCK